MNFLTMLVVLGLAIHLFAPEVIMGQGSGVISLEDLRLSNAMKWHSIGPDRGGRSIAVAGSSARPFEYYFGATGGGLWKTTDGGTNWFPVTDGQIHSSSVGAVAVSASNPDVVYIGMGEAQLRGNVMQGDGVYRSTDGGKSWQHLGLAETQTISRLRIHPSDPDRVYVAALGHPYGPNPERGVFRTLDGGRTWQQILYHDERTGAVDLAMDPNDPDVLYATFWQVHRKPWLLWSGGEGSGLFKSTDGGETWRELTRNPGLPNGVLGKMTVTVSGADSKRVYANIEAKEGGLYRSDDGGETWSLMNNHRDLWQRAFYFLRIQADPVDRETIYILSFRLIKSTDGGKTFDYLPQAHADHHDLWIDPKNPLRMINANDGGGVVSVNGGRTWTDMDYPTAQIYRLTTTNDFPYHLCGAQQDNSTLCTASDGGERFRNPRERRGKWMYAVGGGENGYIAAHPVQTNIFYAGATNTLTRYDRDTGLITDVQPYPFLVMGEPAGIMPERWSWNYPIVLSPADPDLLFVGSQHLWRTADEGKTWDKISPDLTRADPKTMVDSGGPIVFDQDGPEIYATIYTIAPSEHDVSTIWTGSDDGFVHLTRDGGQNWKNVTPPDMLKDSRIGLIEVSPHDPATAYVAAKRYEMDDRSPYLWKTKDYGERWTKIVDGIPKSDFVHVVQEDHVRKGLLYAGTEHGIYVSFDEGNNWHSLSMNLPDVHVSGISSQERDLAISTHGRAFWILPNIEPLRQLDANIVSSEFHLFAPKDAIRRPFPTLVNFYIREAGQKVSVEILDARGKLVRSLFDGTIEENGMQRRVWNLRYPGATVFEGIILEGGNPRRGPWAPPGQYQARLTVNGKVQLRSFNVIKDPGLVDVTDSDLVQQFELAIKIRDKTTAANESVILIRDLRAKIETEIGKTEDKKIHEIANDLLSVIGAVEKELYQVKNQSPKDKIAFPIKLNNRLSGLRANLERGDGPPTRGYYEVFEKLSIELEAHLDRLNATFQEDLPRLNKELQRLGLAPVTVPGTYDGITTK